MDVPVQPDWQCDCQPDGEHGKRRTRLVRPSAQLIWPRLRRCRHLGGSDPRSSVTRHRPGPFGVEPSPGVHLARNRACCRLLVHWSGSRGAPDGSGNGPQQRPHRGADRALRPSVGPGTGYRPHSSLPAHCRASARGGRRRYRRHSYSFDCGGRPTTEWRDRAGVDDSIVEQFGHEGHGHDRLDRQCKDAPLREGIVAPHEHVGHGRTGSTQGRRSLRAKSTSSPSPATSRTGAT
jgi:hypothetical protein